MKILHMAAAVLLAVAQAGKPRRFKIEAYNGGKINVDGFPLPVVVDLQGLVAAAASVPIVLDHEHPNTSTTVGATDEIENDGRRLVMAGPITGAHLPKVAAAIQQFDNGQPWQASIGAWVNEEEEVHAGQTVTVNGQQFAGPLIIARRAELRHTGILPSGADASTTVNLAAASANTKGIKMGFEDWLKSLGIDIATLDEANKAALTSAYNAMQSPAAEAGAMTEEEKNVPTVAASAAVNLAAPIKSQIAAGQKELAATLRRNAAIQAKAAGHPMIAAAAIEQNWSIDRVELEILKAQNNSVRPTSFRKAEGDLPEGEVLEAAVCMARKQKDVEKAYKPEILQAAHSQFKGRVGLQQVIILAAAANGYQASAGQRINMGNLREILAFACPDARSRHLHATAFSTVNLPGILSNVANKEILAGYMDEDPAWQEIADKKSVNDFKQVTSYRLLDDMEYEELEPGGSIKGGAISEESYTRQAKTYAKMFMLERTQIVNDDLGAFDDLRERVGRGAARKLVKVFWTAFINNSTFYTAARTNYITGSTTNLGTDGVGLSLSVTAFRKMTSPTADGSKRVGQAQRPELLLVPPELEHNADKLHQGANLNVGSGPGEENVFRNKYQPLVAWQLSDTAYTGYSATAFYLLSKSMRPVVVSFLDGVETPTVDTADADFNQLGIQFRGYHDFGVDLAEYLGSLKSKGAA